MARISFIADIEKFGTKGEKTGWTYISVPLDIAEKIAPNQRTSFRVKGTLDQVKINGMAMIPMGEGNFILPLKAEIRKIIKKIKGDQLQVILEIDQEEYQLNEILMECMLEDKVAHVNFNRLPRSHQNYYSKYIDAAKTDPTKAKRIAQVVNAMHHNLTYAEMLRASRKV